MTHHNAFFENQMVVLYTNYPDNQGENPRFDHAIRQSEDGIEPPEAVTFAEMMDAVMFLFHQRNQEQGWWTDLKTNLPMVIGERPRAELCCLVHSEWSEGLEAVRKDLNDDKLPEFKGLHVECADAVIRLFDIIGAEMAIDPEWSPGADYKNLLQALAPQVMNRFMPGEKPSVMLDVLHSMLGSCSMCLLFSDCYEGGPVRSHSLAVNDYRTGLVGIVVACFRMAEALGFDLAAMVILKDAYNRQRADHKIENRLANGGKTI